MKLLFMKYSGFLGARDSVYDSVLQSAQYLSFMVNLQPGKNYKNQSEV